MPGTWHDLNLDYYPQTSPYTEVRVEPQPERGGHGEGGAAGRRRPATRRGIMTEVTVLVRGCSLSESDSAHSRCLGRTETSVASSSGVDAAVPGAGGGRSISRSQTSCWARDGAVKYSCMTDAPGPQ